MSKTHYPLKLKNEFYVTRSGLEKLFAKKKVFTIGYGSLLFADGWTNRGMKAITTPNDLIECVVHNYKRGTFGVHTGAHFYGAIPSKQHHFNAVLNPIHSFYDWVGLMQTEFIAGMFENYNYRVVDVTANITGVRLPKNAAVHMVTNEHKNEYIYKTARPAPGYYEYVWKGVKDFRSAKFKGEFLRTGGITHVKYKQHEMSIMRSRCTNISSQT